MKYETLIDVKTGTSEAVSITCTFTFTNNISYIENIYIRNNNRDQNGSVDSTFPSFYITSYSIVNNVLTINFSGLRNTNEYVLFVLATVASY